MDLKLDGTKVTGTAGPDESKQWANGGSLTFDLVFDGDPIRGSAAGTGNGGEKMSAKVDLKRVS